LALYPQQNTDFSIVSNPVNSDPKINSLLVALPQIWWITNCEKKAANERQSPLLDTKCLQ
ncbi:MAG: hypothetical protein AB2569_18780, partial [Candidatus Thiodiazotropha endolucinida]